MLTLALLLAGCGSVPEKTPADTSPGDLDTVDTGETADSGDTDSGDTDSGDTADTAPTDADADGWTVEDGDCDDANDAVHPGATEVCNDRDDDCDAAVDEDAVDAPTWYADADADGYGVAAVVACDPPEGSAARDGDCDDADPAFHPGADEPCTEAVDYNCDGSTGYADADRDGVAACEDCDDADPTALPGGVETCDGADDDCDGDVDEDAVDMPTWHADADGDGFGDPGTSTVACEAAGFVGDATDCDDTRADVSPAAPEVCDVDDVDEDCDGLADDADPGGADGTTSGFADLDGDGYGDPAAGLSACDLPAGYVSDGTDCNDARAEVSPAGAEVCDPHDLDEDCDGLVDDADPDVAGQGTWYADADGDAYGDAAVATTTCDAPAGYVTDATDCDDGAAGTNPGAVEVCDADATDEDCDGVADDDDLGVTGTTLWHQDLDSDGYGGAIVFACVAPPHAATGGDCDDTDPAVSPDAVEVCDGVDQDCDGTADDGLEGVYFLDVDGDSYGDPDHSSCALASGYASEAGDCDDDDAAINPGETEVCGDGVDQDCDGGAPDCTFSGTYSPGSQDVRLRGDTTSDYLGAILEVGDLDGDGTDDLVAGMPLHTVATSTEGATAVWYGPLATSGTVSATSDALLTGASRSDQDGSGLAVGDHDGDGVDDLFAYTYDYDGFTNVYVLYGGSRHAGTSTTASLADATLTGTAQYDYFATEMAAGGDLDGDGFDELLVGGMYSDTSAVDAGEVWLFYGDATRLSGSSSASTAAATFTGAAAGDTAGWSLAFAPDMDGDGLDEVVIGAYRADDAGADAGAAYLFLGGSTRLAGANGVSTADVTWLGAAAGDRAGCSVAGLGDVDGDGYGDVGVGGYGYDPGGLSSAGGVWVYGGGSLGTSALATLEGIEAGETFGFAVTSPGDLDADGTNDVLVGAQGNDDVGNTAGAAYLFQGPLAGTIPASDADATFYPEGGETSTFGRGLPAGAGDLTGDARPDLVIGAPYSDWRDPFYGSVYVWAGLEGM